MNHLQAEAMEREVRAAHDACVWVGGLGDDEETIASLGLDGHMPLDLVIEIGEIVRRYRTAGVPKLATANVGKLRQVIEALQALEAVHGPDIDVGVPVRTGGGHGDPGYTETRPVRPVRSVGWFGERWSERINDRLVPMVKPWVRIEHEAS